MLGNNFSFVPHLMYYDRQDKRNRFYFSVTSTRQVLFYLPENQNIKKLRFIFTDTEHYLSPDDFMGKNIKDLRLFFDAYPSYDIDDLELSLENGILLSTHDDSEVTFSFPENYDHKPMILKLLKNTGFEAKIVYNQLLQYENHYVEFSELLQLQAVYSSFEAYLTNTEKVA